MSGPQAAIKLASSEISSGDPAPGASKLSVAIIQVAESETEVAGQDPWWISDVQADRVTWNSVHLIRKASFPQLLLLPS